jgi:hypothetical protein
MVKAELVRRHWSASLNLSFRDFGFQLSQFQLFPTLAGFDLPVFLNRSFQLSYYHVSST